MVETKDVCLSSILWFVCGGIDYPLLFIVEIQKNMHDLNAIFCFFFSHHLTYAEQTDFKRMFAFEIWSKIPDQCFSKASNTKSEKLSELQEA